MSDDEAAPVFLTVKETAELFSVTDATVRLWIVEGKLEALKINPRTWRIPMVSIKEMVNKLHGEPLEF